MRTVKIGNVEFGNDMPFRLIAGPCQLESERHAFDMAHQLQTLCLELSIGFVFKTSFDKANRTSANSPRGIGLTKALEVFDHIRACGIPVLTDVHETWQCEILKSHVDCLQIPALLSRQTSLLQAASATGLPVNIKKGQFMSPFDVFHAAVKCSGDVLLTERGNSFGYNDIIVDMRNLNTLRPYPVIFDATHTVQNPGGNDGMSGGNRYYTPCLARAAVAVGVAGIFIECHQDPDNAPSDGPCMMHLKDMKPLLEKLKQIDHVVKEK